MRVSMQRTCAANSAALKQRLQDIEAAKVTSASV